VVREGSFKVERVDALGVALANRGFVQYVLRT
jgi:hypothetical protein